MNYFLENRIPSAASLPDMDMALPYAEGGDVSLEDLVNRYSDDERDMIPRGEEIVPLESLIAQPAAPQPAAAQYDERGNLLPSPDSPLAKMSGGTPDWLRRMQAFGATPSLIPDLMTPGTGGKDIGAGDLFKRKRDEALQSYEQRIEKIKSAGYMTPEIEQQLKDGLSATLDQLSKAETGYLNSLPQRQVLSDLLKNNQFSEAYKYAQDNGMQALLMDPSQLRDMRDPFTKDEAKLFIRSMPQDFIKSYYSDQQNFDEAWKFDPEGAEERGALVWGKAGPEGVQMSETGYPMLERVLKPQEVRNKSGGIFEKIFKAAAIAAAVFGGAHLLGALGSAGGAAAGAGAGGAGAGATGAAAAKTAAATAAKTAAASTAAGATGAAAAGLPTITVIGSKAAVSPLLAAAGATGAGLAASQLGGGAAGGAGAGAGTPPVDPALEEVLVQAGRRSPYSLLGPGTLATTSLVQGMSDIPVDIYGRPVDPATGQPEPDLTEGKLEAAELPMNEFTVYGTGGSGADLMGALGAGLGSAQITQGYTPPSAEPSAFDLPDAMPFDPSMKEFMVYGTRGSGADLIGALGAGLGSAQLMQGYTNPNVDPFTGEPVEPVDPLKEEPTTWDKLQNLYDKYGKYVGPAASLVGGIAGALAKPAQDLSGGRGVGATYDPRTAAGGIAGRVGQWIDWDKVKQDAANAGMSLTEYTAQNLNKVMNRGLEAGLAQNPAPSYNPEEDYYDPDLNIMDGGGGSTGMATGGRLMRGGGHGRDDLIPARLSDGEYVIDAETVALLGNGSTKAGGLALDRMRAEVRKHKGKKLAKGKFSSDAKSPLAYLKG